MSREEEFEKRLAALEQAVAELQRLVGAPDPRAGLNKLIGSITDHEVFEEALRYGREYRHADRPRDEDEEES
ncbi:MAG: transferase hexapeptide repeat containing protein [Solirubrobacteraceae bacterium]